MRWTTQETPANPTSFQDLEKGGFDGGGRKILFGEMFGGQNSAFTAGLEARCEDKEGGKND